MDDVENGTVGDGGGVVGIPWDQSAVYPCDEERELVVNRLNDIADCHSLYPIYLVAVYGNYFIILRGSSPVPLHQGNLFPTLLSSIMLELRHLSNPFVCKQH